MRLLMVILLSFTCLFGCTSGRGSVSDGLIIREQMTTGDGCAFSASVTADYGDRMYSFTMDCTAQADGTINFTITEPESISGIKGSISQSGGKLLFDDTVLLFESLTSNQITPAIGPYLMVKAIQGGYIRSVCTQKDSIELTIDDSFRSQAFQALITLSVDHVLQGGEIFFNNRRILSIQVENFEQV